MPEAQLVAILMHRLRKEDREAMQLGDVPLTRKKFHEKALQVQTQTLPPPYGKRAREGEDSSGYPPAKQQRPAQGNLGGWQGSDRGNGGDTRTPGAPSQGGSTPYGGSAFEGQGGGPAAPPVGGYASQGSAAQKCYRCNQYGHISRECHLPLSATVCYHCRQEGHMARECPHKGGDMAAPATGSNSNPIPPRNPDPAPATGATTGGNPQ